MYCHMPGPLQEISIAKKWIKHPFTLNHSKKFNLGITIVNGHLALFPREVCVGGGGEEAEG